MSKLIKDQSHSKKWWAKKYAQYRKSFFTRKRSLKKKYGLEPYRETPVTFSKFQTAYAAERNDRIDDIEEGKRKKIGNINEKLVSDSIYEISEKKAYAILEYMKSLNEDEKKALGFNFSYKNMNALIAKIRQGQFAETNLGLWEKIKARRKELFEMGYTKAEIGGKHGIISNEFFYPEEEQ